MAAYKAERGAVHAFGAFDAAEAVGRCGNTCGIITAAIAIVDGAEFAATVRRPRTLPLAGGNTGCIGAAVGIASSSFMTSCAFALADTSAVEAGIGAGIGSAVHAFRALPSAVFR